MEKARKGKADERCYIDRLEPSAKKRYADKLTLIDGNDPYELTKRLWCTDPDFFPSVDYFSIVNYFVYGVSAYTMQEFRSFKSLNAYKTFVSGWVREVAVYTPDGCDHTVVIAKVLHSQRLNEKALQPWIIFHKDEIKTGHCTCMAGIGESCSHMAALAFILESYSKARENATCTDVKAYWKVPHGVKGVEPAPAYKIDFASSNAKKNQVEKFVAGDADAPQQRERKSSTVSAALPSAEEVNKLLSRLHLNSQNTKTESVPTVLKVQEEYCHHFKIQPSTLSGLPINFQMLHDPKCEQMEYCDLLEHCMKINIPTLSEEEVAKIETMTQGQSTSKQWFQVRTGRITASNMYAACHTDPEKPARCLMKKICSLEQPQTFKHLPPIKWGVENEGLALASYSSLAAKNHSGFSKRKNGLYVSTLLPFLGASPDAVVSCTCCGQGCVEIKCPFSAKHKTIEEMMQDRNFFLQSDNGAVSLKQDHKHYYQVQCQLLVTGFHYCDFVVWSTKDTCVIRILPDQAWRHINVPKITRLFKVAVLPEIVGKFWSRKTGDKRPLPPSPSKLSPKKKSIKI